jgi:hypothetical protein
MNIDGGWAPRQSAPTQRSAASPALLAPCGFCWAEPGRPCTDAGQHYARYLRIYRRGVLDRAGLAVVSKAVPYITAGTIVPDAWLRPIAPVESEEGRPQPTCSPPTGPQERL